MLSGCEYRHETGEVDHKKAHLSFSFSFYLIYAIFRDVMFYLTICKKKKMGCNFFLQAIRKIFPNASGTRIIFIDDTLSAFLYNPVNGVSIEVPQFSPSTTKVKNFLPFLAIFPFSFKSIAYLYLTPLKKKLPPHIVYRFYGISLIGVFLSQSMKKRCTLTFIVLCH